MLRLIRFFKVFLYFSNWYTFIFDYFGLVRQKSIIYKLRNGVKFYARPSTHDKFVISEIWSENIYNPPGFDIEQNDLVIDVGAYIGDFTVFAAKKANKGRIFALEPFPQNYDYLVKNIRLNKLKNVIPINKALSNENGLENIYIAKINTGGHTTVKEYLSGDSLKVRSISLHKLFSEYKLKRVDYLKMDCEGAEYKILLKSSKSVLEKVQRIAMEYHDIDNKRNSLVLEKFLRKNGFWAIKIARMSRIIYASRININ